MGIAVEVDLVESNAGAATSPGADWPEAAVYASSTFEPVMQPLKSNTWVAVVMHDVDPAADDAEDGQGAHAVEVVAEAEEL